MTVLLSIAAAFLVGALITLQTGSNAQLREVLGALPAIIASSALGIVVLVVVGAAMGVSAPSLQRFAGAPWSAWIGGLCGAVYAVTVVLLAQRLGAATLTALVVTGQLVCSVVLDHFGLIGFELHPAGMARIAGCLLMVAGLALIWRF
jgi:bacterial/archaeal transporter family-2 protein